MNRVKRFHQQLTDLNMSECHPRRIPTICDPTLPRDFWKLNQVTLVLHHMQPVTPQTETIVKPWLLRFYCCLPPWGRPSPVHLSKQPHHYEERWWF